MEKIHVMCGRLFVGPICGNTLWWLPMNISDIRWPNFDLSVSGRTVQKSKEKKK